MGSKRHGMLHSSCWPWRVYIIWVDLQTKCKDLARSSLLGHQQWPFQGLDRVPPCPSRRGVVVPKRPSLMRYWHEPSGLHWPLLATSHQAKWLDSSWLGRYLSSVLGKSSVEEAMTCWQFVFIQGNFRPWAVSGFLFCVLFLWQGLSSPGWLQTLYIGKWPRAD